MADYSIVITNGSLRPITDPFPTWSKIDCTLNFNAVSTASFEHPADPRLLTCDQPGNRVAIYRNGKSLIAGPIEKPFAYRWSTDQASAGEGVVTVGFADDLALVTARLAYPNPAKSFELQDVDAYTVVNGNVETTLRNLVNLNAGPGALPNRRVPNLALGAVAGIAGTPVNVTARFDVLGDLLRFVALSGGGVGYRVRESSGVLLFEVYQLRDRSKSVVFSRQLNNLTSLSTDPEAPVATAALVGGSGDGAARILVERTNANALAAGWPRLETFVNQSGVSDTTGLRQYGDQALSDNAEKVGLTAVAIDTASNRFTIDYNLGDTVGVVLATGVLLTDTVQSVRVQADPVNGETINPTIGSTDATSNASTVQLLRDMLRRLSVLERT